MSKSLFSLVALVVMGSKFLFAQNVDDGRKYFYYQRYQSAKETFEQILEKNPNNIEAAYWLGQTLLEEGDSLAAKNLYQKLLTQNGNAPLLLAGMGQIELMEGKKDDARQRFETAISMTKGKDVDIYNAVARANIEAKNGDANYAIEKLNQATEVKRFKDPTTYLLMGDAYRKLVDGGNAVQSYEKAYAMDDKLAEAKYSIGKIYLTQQNYSFYLKGMQDALFADPNYAPALYDLYVYYFNRDINEASSYLEKYAAVADQTPSLTYDRNSVLFAARQYQPAIDTAKMHINELGEKADPRYYKLIAYSYAALKDTANAKTYMDQYFAKQKESGFLPMDYAFYGQILGRTPGSEDMAFGNYEKAVALDTTRANKVKLMDEAAKLAQSIKNYQQSANWYGKIYRFDPNPSNRDLYNYGYAHLQADNYDSALAIFKTYQEKYPDEIYGYLWASRAAQGIDTAFEMGIAADEHAKFADAARHIDSVKYKSYIVQSYSLVAQYYNNIKKEPDTAIAYLQKVLEVDPENEQAKKFIAILQKSLEQQGNTQRSSGSAASRSTTSAEGSKK